MNRLFWVSAAAAAAFACGGLTEGTTPVPTPPPADAGAAQDASSSSSSSSASSSSASSSSSSSSSGGADAGKDASLPGAPITFGGCVAFAPCGGALDGVWDYTGGCIEDPLAEAKAQCPGIVEKSLAGSVSGTLTIAAPSLKRKATQIVRSTIEVPAACTQGYPCAFVGTGIQSQIPGSKATCTGASVCTCDVTITRDVDSATTFTQAGNSIATAAGDTFDVCQQALTLDYVQTGGATPQPGSYELTKR